MTPQERVEAVRRALEAALEEFGVDMSLRTQAKQLGHAVLIEPVADFTARPNWPATSASDQFAKMMHNMPP